MKLKLSLACLFASMVSAIAPEDTTSVPVGGDLTSIALNGDTQALTWTHLELGAGNYGEDGHTKKSQRMTVLMQLHATNKKTYVDDLEDEAKACGRPKKQFQILYHTLDQLIAKFGTDNGLFHVNDLFQEYSDYAADRLRDYAMEKGYVNLRIESVPGDYANIDPKETLRAYGLELYDSVHMKNHEVSFFYERMDGNDLFVSNTTRLERRHLLAKLAGLSKDGMYFFVIFDRNFLPEEEQRAMLAGEFYKPTNEYKNLPYVFPEGREFSEDFTRVFFISTRRDV